MIQVHFPDETRCVNRTIATKDSKANSRVCRSRQARKLRTGDDEFLFSEHVRTYVHKRTEKKTFPTTQPIQQTFHPIPNALPPPPPRHRSLHPPPSTLRSPTDFLLNLRTNPSYTPVPLAPLPSSRTADATTAPVSAAQNTATSAMPASAAISLRSGGPIFAITLSKGDRDGVHR